MKLIFKWRSQTHRVMLELHGGEHEATHQTGPFSKTCRCCTDCHQPDLVCLKAPHNRNRVPSNSCCIESPGRIHRQRVHIGRRSAFSPCLHLRALYQCQYGMPSLTEAATQPNLSAPAGCTTTMKAPAIAETEQTSKSSQED